MGKDNFAKALATFLTVYTQETKEKKREMKEEERFEKLFGLQQQDAELRQKRLDLEMKRDRAIAKRERTRDAREQVLFDREIAQYDADLAALGMPFDRYMAKEQLDISRGYLDVARQNAARAGAGGGAQERAKTRREVFEALPKETQYGILIKYPGGPKAYYEAMDRADAEELVGSPSRGGIDRAPSLEDLMWSMDPQEFAGYLVAKKDEEAAFDLYRTAAETAKELMTPDAQKAAALALENLYAKQARRQEFELRSFGGGTAQGQQSPSQEPPKTRTPKTPEKRTNLQNTPLNASPVLKGMAAIKDKPMAERGIGENLMALPYPMLNLFMNAGKSAERALLGLSPEAVLPGQEGLSGAIDPYGINPEKIQQYPQMFGTPYMFPWQQWGNQ